MSKMGKRIIGAVTVFAVVVVVIFNKAGGCVSVKKIDLKNKIVRRTVSVGGEIKSKQEANLSFSVVGRLAKTYVVKGEKVTKGQLLAYVDNYSNHQTTQSYKDARDITIRNKDKYIENYASNLQAAGGEDEYLMELRSLDELISQAEASYQAQIGVLNKTYIYAPFDGNIVDLFVEEGETVLAGAPVMELSDLSQLIFEIKLDQEDFGLLKIGQEVDIKLDSYEDQTFMGKINTLPFYVDGSGSDFVIEVDLADKTNKEIYLGMSGDAYIILSETDSEVQALAFDEILYDIEGNPYIWTLVDKHIKKVYLELGLEGDIYTEIKTDIENAIVKPANDKIEIEEGDKAKITNAE